MQYCNFSCCYCSEINFDWLKQHQIHPLITDYVNKPWHPVNLTAVPQPAWWLQPSRNPLRCWWRQNHTGRHPWETHLLSVHTASTKPQQPQLHCKLYMPTFIQPSSYVTAPRYPSMASSSSSSSPWSSSSSCDLSNRRCRCHGRPPCLSILCSMIDSCQTNVDCSDIGFNCPQPSLMWSAWSWYYTNVFLSLQPYKPLSLMLHTLVLSVQSHVTDVSP